MPAAGTAHFRLVNMLDVSLPDNFIAAFLNDIPLMKLGRTEGSWVCAAFNAGDELLFREEFGQLSLSKLRFRCDNDKPLKEAPIAPGQGVTCASKQEVLVRTKGGACDAAKRGVGFGGVGGFAKGQVARALSRDSAIVNIRQDAPGTSLRAWQQVVNATELVVKHEGVSEGRTRHCSAFEFAVVKTGVVIVADGEFGKRYRVQMKTIRCFTSRHGYDFWILKPGTYSACNRFYGFFFQKHCIVSEFLATQQPDYVVVVLDADVVAVVLERGLEQWLTIDADLQFYERAWVEEIAAGNYIARNTQFARSFLLKWAEFQFRQPTGFSSADNGAIHLHVLETLKIPGTEVCEALYKSLIALSDDLDPYFNFVNCTKKLLGPPRHWKVEGGGTLIIWPRLHFFVVDGFMISWFASVFHGPVMHHGLKTEADVTRLHYKSVDRCKLKGVRLKTGDEFSRTVYMIVKGKKSLYPQGRPCPQCIDYCMEDFSCRPLRFDEKPLPRSDEGCPDCVAAFDIPSFRFKNVPKVVLKYLPQSPSRSDTREGEVRRR
eukprot:TRINITY_DN26624_c0_g1_i1.p1 TRINITY_DN26624_c0_g1~~TRINITY_DN26624_c0_g1_i1.p1  ORF type:complete len:632 (-),score=128.21 TRINITY_DN26624_c0_g1_i1:59-1693(-)